MTLSPLSIAIAPEDRPQNKVDELAVRDILQKRAVESGRHNQILETLNEGVRDYCWTKIMEDHGAQRRDVTDYKDVLRNTLEALRDLLGIEGSRFGDASRAIIQTAQVRRKIPGGDYTRQLFEAFATYAQAVLPIIAEVGESPRGREGQHLRHARFAAQFLDALRRLRLPTRTGRSSLATLLFDECLKATGESLSVDRADAVLREAARGYAD